jgi:hypothetical protein
LNVIALNKNAMKRDAIKLELIEWLAKLEDPDTIEYLKVVKDSTSGDHDWWDDLTEDQKKGIERGLQDIADGKTVQHEVVKNKYGL